MKYLVIFAMLAVGSSAQMTAVNTAEVVGLFKENIDLLETSFNTVLKELNTRNDQNAETLREIITAVQDTVREFPTSNLTDAQKLWLTKIQKFTERYGLFGAEFIENYFKINTFKPSPAVQQAVLSYGVTVRQVTDQVRTDLRGFVEAVYSFDIRFVALIKDTYAPTNTHIEELVNFTQSVFSGLDNCMDSPEIRKCVATVMETHDAFKIIALTGKITTASKIANTQLQNAYNNMRTELPTLRI